MYYVIYTNVHLLWLHLLFILCPLQPSLLKYKFHEARDLYLLYLLMDFKCLKEPWHTVGAQSMYSEGCPQFTSIVVNILLYYVTLVYLLLLRQNILSLLQ